MASTRTSRSVVNKVTGLNLVCLLRTVASAAALVFAGPAGAQAPAAVPPATAPAAKAPATAKSPQKALDKPVWSQLSRPQQVALEPLAAEWDKMEGVRKQKWLEIANRFSSMKPDEQQRVHERMRDWVKMTPEERRVVRENYTRTKKIDPGQKSEQWEKYQQLPEEQKKKLAAEAASARAKKQVANLPSAAQSNTRTVAPIKRNPTPAPCAAGTVANTAASAPPCVPLPGAAPALAPVPPPPVTPAAPAPNAKQ